MMISGVGAGWASGLVGAVCLGVVLLVLGLFLVWVGCVGGAAVALAVVGVVHGCLGGTPLGS